MAENLSIGQQLRQMREERGLTPEQAAYQCRVPIRLLQALESDDYRVVPDPGYLIRPLHEYARLLKLDVDALQVDFRSAIRRPPSATLAVAPSPEPPVVPWKQVIWTVAAILVVVPLVFIALSLASKRAAEQPAAPPPVMQSPQVHAPAEGEAKSPVDRGVPEGPETGQRIEAPAAGEPPLPLATPPARTETLESGPVPAVPSQVAKPGRFRLLARAVETTWISVRADGGQEQQVLLQRGQTARFAADTGFLVTVGNAGGVHFSLNGEPLASLGASGQVIRDLAIPLSRSNPDALQPLPPGPAPASSGR